MTSSSFYVANPDGTFGSTPAVVGPWDPRASHGSPPASLLLRTIERGHPRTDVRVARIAFDFFGPVPVADLAVTSEVVRPGKRIELTRASLSAGGKTAMVASAWRVDCAPDRVPDVPDPRTPPALPPAHEAILPAGVTMFGYGEATEWRYVEGRFDELGPATVYCRPKLPLLEGEEVSPLGRLLLMVDTANGASAVLPWGKYTFVPVELSVFVRRHPRTEWVGMHAVTTVDRDGVGLARAELFDEAGYLGTAVQTLFVAPR